MTEKDVVLSLAGNVASYGVNTAFDAICNRVRNLVEDRKLCLDYRRFLEYLFENKECDYSHFADVLRNADQALSFEALRESFAEEVAAVCDDRDGIPAYVDVILLCVAQRSNRVRAWVEERKVLSEKNAAEIERNRFLIELGNLFYGMFHSGDFFSPDWFDEELELSTGGKLSLGFFSGFDAMFEGKLEELVRKEEYGTIEVYASDDRVDAFYYVLHVLRKIGAADKVKVIRDRKVWEGKPCWDIGDILVADFDDYQGMTLHGRCINIRIHDRNTPPDGNTPNYLVLRHPSTLVLRERLCEIFPDEPKRVQSLIEESNGNFSLIEAELTHHHIDHSWDGIEPGDSAFGTLVDFLVVPRFTSSDFGTMKKAGLDGKRIRDTARRIDSGRGCHLYHKWKKNDVTTYSLASPDRLWAYCMKKDEDEFPSLFIEKALTLLSVEGVSSGIVNGVVYTFIRHYPDLGNTLSRDDFFLKIASVLLRRNDRGDITGAMAELSPRLMLNWFRCYPSEIRDSNFNALALLMHDERYSGECIRLILSSYNSIEDGYLSRTIGELIEEFFRAEMNTSGLSAEDVCEVLKEVKNPSAVSDLIFRVLYRERCTFSLVYVYYRYSSSYAEKREERSREEFFAIEECEMKWFLENADARKLVDFVSGVDFVYFDIFPSLENAVNRVKETSSEVELSRLYIAFFNLYFSWYFNRWPYRDETICKLRPVLDSVVPLRRDLRIVPYFLYHCPHYDCFPEEKVAQRVDRDDFYMAVVPVVKKEGVTFEEYLKLSSVIDDDGDANWEDYIKVMFSVYEEEAVAGEVFARLPEAAGRIYVSLLCRDYSNSVAGVCGFLDDDDRYRFADAAPYSAVKNMIKELPSEMQDRYWSGRLNFYPGELDYDDKKYALDMLILHSSLHATCICLECWCDVLPDEDLCYFISKLSGDGKSRHNPLYPKKVFERIRAYSDSGHIPFDTVLGWERKLLTNRELVGEDTFFTRSFRQSPEILCSLLEYLYPVSGSRTRPFDGNEFSKVYELYSLISVCPGVDREYSVDYDSLSSWVTSFISMMKKRGQQKNIPEGLSKVLSWSTRNFDDILPDAVCSLLENIDREYRGDTVCRLASELQFRRGCFM